MKIKKFLLILPLLGCLGLMLAACGQPEEESSEEQSDSQVESFEESEPSESIPPAQESEEEASQASEPPRNEDSVEESMEESRSDSESSGPSNDSGENSSEESGLPEYQPGSLQLYSTPDDEFRFERPYRYAYYVIWGEFDDLLDEEQLADWDEFFPQHCVETRYGEDQDEMLLVTFVKRYNISREDFDRAVDKFIANNRDSSCFMTHEVCEVPNADIIYTFDNEIINYYYRYE